MKNHDALLVYYAKSAATQKVAKLISGALHCDTEEVIEADPFTGVWGLLRAGYQTLADGAPRIKPTKKDPSQYQLVIIGTPVWLGKIASPMHTYLIKHSDQFKTVAFYLTYSGAGKDLAIQQLPYFCERVPLTHLAVKSREVMNGSAFGNVRAFTDRLRPIIANPEEQSVAS